MEIEREEMENEAVTSESTKLPNPTDPAHVQKNNIKYNEAFVKLNWTLSSSGPVPKKSRWAGHWYDENPWLEHSPQSDAIYCFSCRIFMNDDKYKSRSTRKSGGVNRWRQAKVRSTAAVNRT
ncbi:hypothetical protein F7725_024265 [Dissostichus mawsoni]|uniref:Uncharacterized protein n=1 Tax=Dissostichus mawsoni TaxID=36200 RepID=A0A7J5XYV5_DISMA|nr:hypothetical protein F7725_024265 [Dissostichus mawsoni]